MILKNRYMIIFLLVNYIPNDSVGITRAMAKEVCILLSMLERGEERGCCESVEREIE